MKKYGVNELRKMYLDFFESKNHLKLNSFSLIPHNDKSLLLINSGMAPLKPYFTGQEIPPSKRVTTCQKCIRTGDIENVGKTSRHGTFFEMLGNFSFGDYFKKEAIAWSWEFLTEVVGLDADRLYPSVYLEDDEAADIWHNDIGISRDRIVRLGEDNFWEHGTGPCGPCSEIYYDRGEQYGCDDEKCFVGCECDRYIEVWNNVFTQFEKDDEGNYTPLKFPNIDTGMGLERLAVIVQDVESIFDIDTVRALREKVCEMAGVSYKTDAKKDISIRLITDHVRATTFLISDGVIPSNEGRGYVLRRLIRRAARHGRLLGIKDKFLSQLSQVLIGLSGEAYRELEEKRDYILKLLSIEEERFNETIDQGLTILSELKEKLNLTGSKVLSGDDAFKLYDTYGFPLDLTKEILEEEGIEVDEDGFAKAMDIQRTTARSAREVTNYMGADVTVYDQIDASVTSEFMGYEYTEYISTSTVLASEAAIVDTLSEGERGTIFTVKTPFYATSGGQTADIGWIYGDNSEFVVEDTIKLLGGKIGHVGYVKSGQIKLGEQLRLVIDMDRRLAIAKNHSATHLLQKALKNVLGSHIEQAGSSVTPERLRFDFTHFAPLTSEELQKVEDEVNQHIQAGYLVGTQVMDIEDAKKSGAMALFGEKYDQKVRVVTMGEYSKELCGGTHVDNTASISTFKIISESGIAAGVRRIEALTARGAADYYKHQEEILLHASKLIRTEPTQLLKKLESLLEDIKVLQQENEKLKNKMLKGSIDDILSQIVDVSGVRLLATSIKDVDGNGLRTLGDQLKEKIGEGVLLLVSSKDDKVNLVAMATEGVIKLGAHAGNLIKEVAGIVEGSGGGRPNMAQAGGKNTAKIQEAVKAAESILLNQLNK